MTNYTSDLTDLINKAITMSDQQRKALLRKALILDDSGRPVIEFFRMNSVLKAMSSYSVGIAIVATINKH